MRRAGPLGLSLGLLVTACQKQPVPPPRGQFGVLYGGQIQERDEIPLELDRTKIALGFRVDFAAPLSKPAALHWELTKRIRDSKGKVLTVVELGDAAARVGADRFEENVLLSPTDAPGAWALTVNVDGARVIDRKFSLLAPGARARDGG